MAWRNFVCVACLYFSYFFLEINADSEGVVSCCNWLSWEPWSECSSTCGGGISKRFRRHCCVPNIDSVACMSGCGHDMSYYYNNSDESQKCNENCFNGGVFSGSQCHCKDIFYGRCCSYSCPSIDNCKRRYCFEANNTSCTECYDENTFYKRTNSSTKCERMCAWNSHYCWPGYCSNELTRGCSCAPDFRKIQTSSETSCQPTKSPSILTCNTVAVDPNGDKKRAMTSGKSTECQYLNDMYGNFQLSSFQFDMTAEFTVKFTGYTQPGFVHESKFGITDTTIRVIKIPVNGKRSTLSVHRQLVDKNASEKAVLKQDDTGYISVNSSLYNLLDGQAYELFC